MRPSSSTSCWFSDAQRPVPLSKQSRKPRTSLSKRLASALWRWCWRLVAFALIVAAVGLTLARILLPFAGEYRGELEQRVESYIGTEVTIGALDIGWHGFVPRVRLTDVAIDTAGPVRETVAFEQAYVTVLPSWEDGAPGVRIAGVSLLGLQLSARIDDDGRIHVLGAMLDPAALRAPATSAATEGEATADATGTGAPPAAALAGVFRIGRLQLLDTTLVITGPDGTVSRWQDVELRLANAGDRHRLSLRVVPPERWGGRLQALLEFDGRPADYRDWRGRLFVDGEALALDAWLDLWPGAPVRVDSGRLDATLWSEWNGGRLIDAQLELGLDDLALQRRAGDAAVAFERIAARLRLWQPDPSQWQVDAGGLEVRRNGRDWGPDAGLSFALEDGGGWRLAAGFARLDDVAAAARVLPLPATVHDRLAALDPAGEIQRAGLAVNGDGTFRLRSDFRDVRWSPLGKIPGMTGLDGRARVGSDGGHVVLESSSVGFEAPELFRAPLRLSELRTVVWVRPIDGGVILDAPRVHARNADVTGRGRVRAEVVRGQAPRLDLQFAYHDGVANAAPNYLPAHVMPPKVVAWLDQAFHGGRVEQGSFTMRGRADDFPFRGHEGVFDVRADIAGVTLHYADGWPAIDGLVGRVHFDGPALAIRADGGTSRGVRLRRGLARIADLREGRLQVDVDAHGPVDGMLGVINDSPLAPRFAAVFGGARGGGEATLALDLDIPMQQVDATRVVGEVVLDGAALAQPAYDLAFSRLDGSVRFTESGVSIDGLTGMLRGRPIRLDAATPGDIAYFRATGDYALAELLPALAEGPLAGSTGRSAWDVVLRVPLGGGAPARLEANSDLRGTQIDLPRPLAKPADTARPLRLEMPLTGDRAGTARLRYGDDIRLALELDQDRGLGLRRLGLAFGEPAALPATPGVRLSGRLQALALSPWLDAASAGGALPLVELELQVRALGYRTYRLSDVRLVGGRTADGGWQLNLASNEATGRVRWPPEADRRDLVRARFDWVDLALLRGEQGDTQGYGRMADPDTLPALDLQVERLKLADTTLREFVLVTGTGGGGRNIHRLDFHTDHLQVQGQGLWRGGNRPRTQLRITVRSQDFGQGLAELGHPGTLANGTGRVTFDLEWPAPPWGPRLGTLSGHVRVSVDEGVLLQVNPGAARLLGMFSLESIPFRTLLQRGLIFQEMSGRVDIADGNAYTNNFKVDSAIGLIKVSGRTGLVARDYDQRVLMQPELASSLPVIGFLSGGPVAGAAIALLQGVMRNLGQDVERVSQVEYSVTGSWDDPRVERVGASGAESGAGGSGTVESPR